MSKMIFNDIVLPKVGFLRGPFGGALKKEIFVPKSSSTYKVYEQGVVLQKNSSIGNYYISQKYFEKEMKRFEVKPNDFLVSCSGVNYGAIYQLKENIERGIINQALLRIRLNREIVDDNFFYYYFQFYIVKKITGGKGNSTIPNFPSMDIVRNIKITLPNLDIQKQIGRLLSSLDSKIELNDHINTELETMAKILYDYWFVQFDFPNKNGKPYKTSGGKMVWNEELKREIPERWEVKSLWDIADYTNGLAMQKFRPISDEFLRVIKIKEMNEGFSDSTELARAEIPEKVIVNNGDILFSWSASLNVMIWTRGVGALNQHIFKVTSDEYPKSFVYYELVNYLNHFKMMAENRKTTMGHITIDHLKQSKIAVPKNNGLLQSIDKIVQPILEKKLNNDIQNQRLTELRDWLLPMLMNGQVKVREAEEMLSMAAEGEAAYGKKK